MRIKEKQELFIWECKRIAGLLRAIDRGKVKEYHDSQDKMKKGQNRKKKVN